MRLVSRMFLGGMGRTGRTIAAVLAVAVLGGCTSGVAAGGSAAPSVDPVAWQECGPNLDCATVEVPVVHTDPDGPTIGLAVVRHRASDPARRIGSLLTNPGGPGGPAAEGVRMIGTPMDPGSWSPELLARWEGDWWAAEEAYLRIQRPDRRADAVVLGGGAVG